LNRRRNAIGVINEVKRKVFDILQYSQKIYKEALFNFNMAEEIQTQTSEAKENQPEEKESEQIESTPSPLELAKQINEDNKKILQQITEERKRLEKASADMLISGRSYMSPKPKEKTEEEKWAERARERYKGTGMDPTI